MNRPLVLIFFCLVFSSSLVGLWSPRTIAIPEVLTYDIHDFVGYPYFALPPDANVLGVKLKFYRDFGNHPNGSVIEARFAQFWFRDYRILVAWAGDSQTPQSVSTFSYCIMEITFDRVANHVSPALNPDPLADAIAPGLITGFREIWRAYPIYDVKYVSQAPSFPQGIYKYLIITDEAWLDVVQPFIQLKAGLGMPVLAVSRQWIEATYSGDSLQQRIWYFLRDAYNRWKPSYLLIAGDINAVPTWTMRRLSPAGDVERMSDWNYAFLDGDSNGYDDMLPDIIVSRLPARDRDSLFDMFSKTVDYHKASPGEWTRRALLIAGEDYQIRKTYMIETMNNFAKDYIPAQMIVTRLYAGYNLTVDNIVSEINKGAAIVVIDAHGNSTGFELLTGSSFFNIGDVAKLSNGPMLPMIDTFSCGLAPYDSASGDYWALAMLRNRAGGAVALTGAPTPLMVLANEMEDGPHIAPYWYAPLLYGEKHPRFLDWFCCYFRYSYLYEHILFRPFRLGDNYLFAAIMEDGLGWYGNMPARNYFGDPDLSLLGFESRDVSLEASAYWSVDGDVTIRALDRNSGNPISGMVVRVVASESFYFESSTDGNGTIRFKLPEALLQSGRADITAYALNYNTAIEEAFTIEPTPSFSFEISLPQPSSQTIQQSASATFAVTATTISGVPREVTLGIDALPPNSSVSWTPSNIVVASTTGSTVEFTMQTSSSTPAQTYADLHVSASGGGTSSKSPPFTLTVTATTPVTTPVTTPTPGPARCVIATAAYGSEMAPDVVYMRYIRDNLIGSSPIGRTLVGAFNAFYYSWSPTVAGVIAGNELLRAIFRVVLLPLIGIVRVTALLFTATTYLAGSRDLASVVAFLVAAAMTVAVYVAFPVLVALEIRQGSRRRRA